MQLNTPFIRLPLRLDAERLAAEVGAFPESAWQPHPEGHRGNAALPLVALHGDPLNNGVKGPMRPTPQLAACPYLRQVLAAFDAPIGRTRLMRIDGNAEATPHVDVNYYWQQRLRVHVPIVTDPAVQFLVGADTQHMRPGEVWIFDTWQVHNVVNPMPSRRIHLVIDTVGSPTVASLVAGGERRLDPTPRPIDPDRAIAFVPEADPPIDFESQNFPVVMSPTEQRALYAAIERGLPQGETAASLHADVLEFFDAWRALWQRHGTAASGWTHYAALRERATTAIRRYQNAVTLLNGVDAAYAVQQILLGPALDTELAPARSTAPRARFARPIFIVSSPRSGSSLLFETLRRSPDVASIGGESHALIESIPALHPAANGWESNRLTERDATPAVADRLAEAFLAQATDRDGRAPRGRFRLIEKTPKNSLRIPFLRAAFPDAMFVYLYRDERATISSMLEAWRSGRFVTYPDLPEWSGPAWSLALTPDWPTLRGKALAEIVAAQWQGITDRVLDDLHALPPESWCVTSYDRLVADPQAEVQRLCDFLGIRWDSALTLPLPSSRYTLTPPDPNKWQANAAVIEPLLPALEATMARARDLFAQAPRQRPPTPVAADAPPPIDPAVAFGSVHTSNFPALLNALGVSLLVSTYQSGRLIAVRADGEELNTHLRYFPSPMGIAFDGDRLAFGTRSEVWDYRNMPDLVPRLHPPGHDACFLPRNMHVTGDIRVHELAFDGDGELWIVATRFSCLCTLDRDRSFVPRWRPRFVSALAAEDRCHLNGLCLVDGKPKYVTALGQTDTFEGWRANKADGGVVIDIDSGAIVRGGLSMPHSPRWHDGKLWLLESGKGTLATVDVATGGVRTVAELPGFTRGLAFVGHYAFIGLSQVRENIFEGIPLSQRLAPQDRSCGVWVVDIRDGSTVGFVQFQGVVQEIFDVQVLDGIRYPELLEPDSDLVGSAFVLTD